VTTFVLVHGAWHGGWCWLPVARRLRSAGHRALAPSLTGLADRSHLLDERVNLSMHVEDIANLIVFEDLENVVLVGHSYGGLVTTLVADRLPERLAALVYLDSQVAADGVAHADRIPRLLAPGLSTPAPPAAAFKVNEADQLWVNTKMTPQPNATFLERPHVTGRFNEVPRKIFVRATIFDSTNIAKEYARVSALPDWTAIEIATGHDIMIDAPDAVAGILLDLVPKT
jgi:pimeloyl-ACP methyl ester carboxylesterase